MIPLGQIQQLIDRLDRAIGRGVPCGICVAFSGPTDAPRAVALIQGSPLCQDHARESAAAIVGVWDSWTHTTREDKR